MVKMAFLKNRLQRNILEKFYFGEIGSFNCEQERKNVNYRKKELEKQKKEFISSSA